MTKLAFKAVKRVTYKNGRIAYKSIYAGGVCRKLELEYTIGKETKQPNSVLPLFIASLDNISNKSDILPEDILIVGYDYDNILLVTVNSEDLVKRSFDIMVCNCQPYETMSEVVNDIQEMDKSHSTVKIRSNYLYASKVTPIEVVPEKVCLNKYAEEVSKKYKMKFV